MIVVRCLPLLCLWRRSLLSVASCAARSLASVVRLAPVSVCCRSVPPACVCSARPRRVGLCRPLFPRVSSARLRCMPDQPVPSGSRAVLFCIPAIVGHLGVASCPMSSSNRFGRFPCLRGWVFGWVGSFVLQPFRPCGPLAARLPGSCCMSCCMFSSAALPAFFSVLSSPVLSALGCCCRGGLPLACPSFVLVVARCL